MDSCFPPMFIVDVLPEEERENVNHLNSILSSLSKYVSDYGSALSLFDTAWMNCDNLYKKKCEYRASFRGEPPADFKEFHQICDDLDEQRKVYSGWQLVAARDITMTVYHFRYILNIITKTVFNSPTLLIYTDEKYLRPLMSKFEKNFIKAERARNAVGHSAEFASTPEQLKRHSVSGDRDIDNIVSLREGGSIFLGSVLEGRKLTMTTKNDVVSVEISSEKLQILKSLRDSVFAALRPAEAELKKQNFERLMSLAEEERELNRDRKCDE